MDRHHDTWPYIVTLVHNDGRVEERYCRTGVAANTMLLLIPLLQMQGQMITVVSARRRPALHGVN